MYVIYVIPKRRKYTRRRFFQIIIDLKYFVQVFIKWNSFALMMMEALNRTLMMMMMMMINRDIGILWLYLSGKCLFVVW